MEEEAEMKTAEDAECVSNENTREGRKMYLPVTHVKPACGTSPINTRDAGHGIFNGASIRARRLTLLWPLL
jgi:hypothetical protein